MILLPISMDTAIQWHAPFRRRNDKLLAIFSSLQSADTKEDSGNVFHVVYVVLHPGRVKTIPRIQTRRLNPTLTRTTKYIVR